jgi:hypothetical protein
MVLCSPPGELMAVMVAVSSQRVGKACPDLSGVLVVLTAGCPEN